VHADALRYSTRYTHNNVRMLTAMMILLLHHTTPAILPEFDAANAPFSNLNEDSFSHFLSLKGGGKHDGGDNQKIGEQVKKGELS